MMDDTISKAVVIKALDAEYRCTDKTDDWDGLRLAISIVEDLPSTQPETCEGCKHLGKWENEVEYGYPSPCTRCKRRAEDRYER